MSFRPADFDRAMELPNPQLEAAEKAQADARWKRERADSEQRMREEHAREVSDWKACVAKLASLAREVGTDPVLLALLMILNRPQSNHVYTTPSRDGGAGW